MPSTAEIWKSEFTANTTDGGPNGQNQTDPVVVQLDNGNTVVLWVDDSDGFELEDGTDIYGQIYDPLGNPVGGEFRANNFSIHDEGNFDAAALSGGDFVVAYEDAPGASEDRSIRVTEWSTTATGIGSPTSRTIASTPDAGDTVQSPSVSAVGTSGDYVVAYEFLDTSIGGAGQYAMRSKIVDPAAGTVGPEQSLLGGSDATATDTEVARLSNGDYVAVTDDFDSSSNDQEVRFRVMDDTNGNVVSFTPVDGTENAENDRDADVAGLTGGGFVVAWTNTDASDTDVKFAIYENDGSLRTGDTIVNGGSLSDNNNEPRVFSLAEGGFVVAYDDDAANSLVFQRYDASGSSVGSAVTVNTGNTEVAPHGAGLEDGRFKIVWEEITSGNSEIKAAYFDPRDDENAGVYTPDSWIVGTIGDDLIDNVASGDDIIDGFAGNDTIDDGSIGSQDTRGGPGDDLILVNSGIGSDTFSGGAGIDTVDWSNSGESSGIFDLDAGTASNGGNTEDMTGFENLIGSGFGDEILGSGADNSLNGGPGGDTIEGGSGTDTLLGGAGNDVLRGGFTTDSVNGGSGNDTIEVLAGEYIDNVDGGAGTDTLDHSALSAANVDGDTFDFLAGTITSDFALGIPTLAGIEVYLDGPGGNTIISSGAGTYSGNGGDDLIVAGLTAGSEFETMDGGPGGTDTLDTTSFNGTYELDMSTGDTNFTNETATGFENVITGSGNDVILGTGGANLVETGGGSDVVDGRAGNDTVEGGAGADSLDGGGGDDSLNGGNGADRLRAIAGNDTLDGGLDASGDTLVGAGGDDLLSDGQGDDFLTARGGSDTLSSGVGNDTVVGGVGADRLEAAGGDDRVLGQGDDDIMFAGVGVDFVAGGAGNDTMRGEGNDDEMLGQPGEDAMFGGAGSDDMNGGGGSDLLVGQAGNDVLNGFVGVDTLRGGGNNDTYVFSNESHTGVGVGNRDIVGTWAQGDDTIDVSLIDALAGGGNDAFTFVGNSGHTGAGGTLRTFTDGGSTIVGGDIDGDGQDDFQIQVTGNPVLTAGDFVL